MFPYRTIYNSDNFFNNEFCFDYIELVDENKEYRYTESIENEIKQKSIENEDIKLLKKDLRKKIKIKHETQDDDIENIMKELDEELTNPEKSWEKRLNSKTEELWKHQD